jgi:polyhydroxybutyrate depolymerase
LIVKKKSLLLLVAALLLGLTVPASRGAAAKIAANGTGAEPFTQTFIVEGVERSAIIVPNSVTAPATGSPLVFIFHGHGGTARNSFRRFAIHQRWPEAVVAYMQGLPTASPRDPQGERPGWQHNPGENNDRDLKFFDAVKDWAMSRYQIDPSRIYAGGHSNGGSMTYVLWAARSDVIAAYAPSASVFGYKGLNATPKPALLVIGRGDTIVPTENQERNAEMVLRLNQCQPPGQEVSPNIKLYQSQVGADTAIYVHNNGHRMPDNTGEMMVRFFKRYKLN